MTELELAIESLKYYNENDPYWNGTYTPETDFEKFCYEHCKEIDILIKYIEKGEKNVARN